MPNDFDAHAWMKTNIAYGADLRADTYATAASLALLCSYLEQDHAQPGPIRQTLEYCAANARLGAMLPPSLLEALSFWKNRYIEPGGGFTYRYNNMNWRPGDDRAIVEAVLRGQELDVRAQLLAMLTLSYRLRNNLFHGLKGIGELNDQRENLAFACAAISGALELL
jgi:hypothetical protein